MIAASGAHARHRDGEGGRCVGSSVLWSCFAPTGARAGDFDVLRGAQPVGYATYTRWSGFYGGALIGEEFDAADFRNIGQSEIQTISGLSSIFDGIPLTNFPRLNSLNTNTPSYSAFAGYNYQFEAAVVGLEFNFTKTSFSAGINDAESHSYFTTVNNTIYDTAYTVTTGASAKLNDSASLRGRLGWAFNNFLPYGFAGVTVAQSTQPRSSTSPFAARRPRMIAPTRRRESQRRRRRSAVPGR